MRFPTITLIALLCLAAVACAANQSRAANPWIEVPGFAQGRYIVLPPNERSDEPPPLCFALHGRGGDAASYSRLWHEALQGRYLVVAPQAPLKNRAGVLVSTWQGSVDRDYLLKIWDDVHARHKIDQPRSIVVGYSAGAGAAWQVVLNRRAQFGGLILHAAASVSELYFLQGLHVFILAGERDTGFTPAKAMRLRDRLVGAGIPAQLQIVEGATHASVYDKVRAAADWVRRGFALPE